MSVIECISLSIVFLPLASGLLAGLFGRLLGRTAVHWIANIAVGGAFFLSVYVMRQLCSEQLQPFAFNLYEWGTCGGIDFHVGFLLDRLTALMMIVVSFVAWMVHIYTIGYMEEDPGYQRFFSYISLFTFGMLMLVMSNNFLQLFFGWEMVGLMSYLLIGFWFHKESAIFANLKAFLVNRVGDFGFVIGLAAIAHFFGSFDYATVFAQISQISTQTFALTSSSSCLVITFICLCLFIGAMGKSAQIPLHVWLPDSMEGPTPISALIHAATMVTAGVFMLARLSPLFEYSETMLNVILVIGSLTCLLMGLVGIVQSDIKRIIAYSTLSQLGYMMIAMGASAYPIGMFHLMTHAFFKALLFLGAGSVIVALHHEQSIWKMGNLRKYMPVTHLTMLMGGLALVGFPFFSGFYSKELIVAAVKASDLTAAPFAYVVALSGILITTIYTFRLLFIVFYGKEQIVPKNKKHLHESKPVIIVPLLLLALPAVVSGAFFVPHVFDGFFNSSIFIHKDHHVFTALQSHYHGVWAMGFSGFVSIGFLFNIMGIALCWLIFIKHPQLSEHLKVKFAGIYHVFWQKCGFDSFYEKVLVRAVCRIGRLCWHYGDEVCIDTTGINGTAHLISNISKYVRRVQTGYLYHYAFAMIIGFMVLVGCLLLNKYF